MAWLYHLVPDEMHGTTLHPLARLKHEHSGSYQEAITKYEGREAVLQQHIPLLDCQWNEVLHLSPVHPARMKDAAGTNNALRAFKIPAGDLDTDKAVFWEYERRGLGLTHDTVHWLDRIDITQHTDLPDKTRAYYDRCRKQDNDPLLFVHVPHVFYNDSLDVTTYDTVTA